MERGLDPSAKPVKLIQSHDPHPTLTVREWRLAVIVALLAGLLRWGLADRRGFWVDEYYTLMAARMSTSEMIKDRLKAGHSPLYYFYARLGLCLGTSERALRVTSATAVTGTVIFLTALAVRLRLRRYLRTLWFLSVIHPFWITAGIELRYYMPLIAISTAALWATARFAASSQRRHGVALAFLLSLVLWIHASAQFLALAIALFLLRADGGTRRRSLRGLLYRLWPVVVGLFASVPFLFLVRHHSIAFPRHTTTLTKGVMFFRSVLEVTYGLLQLWPRALGRSDTPLLAMGLLLLLLSVFLTRRELLRQNNATGWRFLASILGGIPLGMLLVLFFSPAARISWHYLTFLSVPTVICFAVAWHARGGRILRLLYRFLFLSLMITQTIATSLDQGDMHREAVRWVISNHTGIEPVLVADYVSVFALEYWGFSARDRLHTIRRVERNESVTRKKMVSAFQDAQKGFIILYITRAPVLKVLDQLEKEHLVAADRRWSPTRAVTVVAWVKDDKERHWLESLPQVPKSSGPASGNW